MFHEIGYETKQLVRVRIGPLRLGDLPRGHWRPLTSRELASLKPPSAKAAAAKISRRAAT
jgi:16S rRNA U516 pseudouridylate synthase RsuA-like enzyme